MFRAPQASEHDDVERYLIGNLRSRVPVNAATSVGPRWVLTCRTSSWLSSRAGAPGTSVVALLSQDATASSDRTMLDTADDPGTLRRLIHGSSSSKRGVVPIWVSSRSSHPTWAALCTLGSTSDVETVPGALDELDDVTVGEVRAPGR